MPRFSDLSKDRLKTCHPDLQLLFEQVVTKFDCIIIEGHRGKTKQDEAYRGGKSKVQYPNSNHNRDPAFAVDVAPWPLDWNDYSRFYYFGGYVLATAALLKDRGIITHDPMGIVTGKHQHHL